MKIPVNKDNQIIFRRANLSDKNDSVKIIELLELFSLESSVNRPLDIKIKKSLIENLRNFSNTIVYLAIFNSDPIGIAVCFKGFSTFKNSLLINIHDFYIRKDYQRKGIGSDFLDFIELDVKKIGFCRMTLEVNSHNKKALKLYEKKGFCGNKDRDNKKIMFAMSKDLI